MRNTWKKVLAAACTASMLMTMPGFSVLADEMPDEEIIIAEAEEPDDVEPIDESAVSVEKDASAQSAYQENIVGASEIAVGDGVTATFDSGTGTIELFSNGGTLSHTWISDSKISSDKIKFIRIASGPIYFPTDSSVMFSLCKNLKEVNLCGVDTSRVTNMSGMFSGCLSLESVDIKDFDTSRVTNMRSMFESCCSLVTLDVSGSDGSGLKTKQVTDMGYMFTGCSKLENLDVHYFDTSNVTNMDYMFAYCSGLITLDVTGFDTSKVTNMKSLFQKCSKVEELNLSSFDLSGVRFCTNMFDGCQALSLLRTPKKRGPSISLPHALYDKYGLPFSALPEKSIILSTDRNYFSIVRGDTNSYSHVLGDFYTEEEQTSGKARYQTAYGYRLLGDLDRDKDNAEYNAMIDQLNSSWIGSCFGASASMVLNNLGVITLGEEPYLVEEPYYDLGRPRDNIPLRDVINYYHCYQYRNDFKKDYRAINQELPWFRKIKMPDSQSVSLKNFLQHFVEEAKNSQNTRKPFLFSFNIGTAGSSELPGHTVIVCGCEEIDNDNDGEMEYKIKIYDLNERDDYSYMYVENDYSSFNYLGYENCWYFLKYVGIENLENSEYYKLGDGNNNDYLSDYTDHIIMFIYSGSGAKYTMTNSQGKTLSYDGSFSGNMDISSIDIIGDETAYLKLQIPSSDSLKVEGINGDFTMSVEIDGHYYRTSTSGVDEILFSKEEGIVLDGADVYSFEVAVDAAINDYSLVGISSLASGKVKIINPSDSVTLDAESPCMDLAVTYMNENGSIEEELEEARDHLNIFEDNGKIKYGNGINIAKATVTGVEPTYPYTGKEVKPNINVTLDGQELRKNTDYTVEYINNVNAGTATVKIRGNGAYEGNKIAKFTIVKKAEKGFSDVQDSSHPYYKAIYWAAGEGITKGYSDGTFGINRSCTRGEMMMFLWKYAKKPAPKYTSKSPFKDVSSSHAFYKAILWGYQKGITKGYSDGSFGINRNVSRGEAMMFLWKLKGRPAPQMTSKSPFTDVPTSHAFYKAILWGSQKGITKGYTSGVNKGKFGINDNCTRGQIVTFLYRAQ